MAPSLPTRTAAAHHRREAGPRAPSAAVSGGPADRRHVERPRGVHCTCVTAPFSRSSEPSSNATPTCCARCRDGRCGCCSRDELAGADGGVRSRCARRADRHASPDTLTELKWYFEKRRSTSDVRARCRSKTRVLAGHRALRHAAISTALPALVDRWRQRLRAVSSPAIAEALERGTGRSNRMSCCSRIAISHPWRASSVRCEGGRGGGHILRTASTPSASIAVHLRAVDARLVSHSSPRANAPAAQRLAACVAPRDGAAFCAAPDSGSGCDGRGTVA